jgi:hypothetical protein
MGCASVLFMRAFRPPCQRTGAPLGIANGREQEPAEEGHPSGGSCVVWRCLGCQTLARGASMKRILAIAGVMVLALILMDTYQVVKAPSGLTVVRAGQALAADLGPPPPPPPPPVVAPVGKGKAPIGKGKGKAPPPPVVTKG